MLGLFHALYRYRSFITGSVKREFQARYRHSLLGAAWMVLNPLAMITVYTVVFAQVMRNRLPGIDNHFAYSIYLCAGVLTWGFFSEILTRAQNVFLDHANLIKKINFPRLCLPIIVVLNASVNFAIIFGLFVLFLLISGNFPGISFISLIPLLIIQILFSIGLGIMLGIFNVFFRDVGQFFTVLLQFWFWFTPIVYPASILPAAVQPYLIWNPMASLVAAYQTVLVYGQWPQWHTLFFPAFLAIGLCALSMRLFRKHAGEIVDEL